MARFTGWRVTRAGIIFIIVAVVLAALVLVGVRFAQQRGEQARQNDAAEIARQNQESSDTPAIAEATPTPTEETPAATEGTSTPDVASIAPAAPSALPETGIGNFVPVVLLALVTYGAVRFALDRRTQFQR